MVKNAVEDWSETAGDNTDVGNINIAEGAPAANMNNAIREMMAQVATWRGPLVQRENGSTLVATGGSGNAYTLTAAQTITAYAAGQKFLLRLNHQNTGNVTLNVDGLGAKAVQYYDLGTLAEVPIGAWYVGDTVEVVYDGTRFIWLNPNNIILDNTYTSVSEVKVDIPARFSRIQYRCEAVDFSGTTDNALNARLGTGGSGGSFTSTHLDIAYGRNDASFFSFVNGVTFPFWRLLTADGDSLTEINFVEGSVRQMNVIDGRPSILSHSLSRRNTPDYFTQTRFSTTTNNGNYNAIRIYPDQAGTMSLRVFIEGQR